MYNSGLACVNIIVLYLFGRNLEKKSQEVHLYILIDIHATPLWTYIGTCLVQQIYDLFLFKEQLLIYAKKYKKEKIRAFMHKNN
jgi:hypothetical protein